MSHHGKLIEVKGYTLLAGRGPVRQQAINDPNFEATPLSTAIDELATELLAANDLHHGQTAERVLDFDDDALLAWFYEVSNAPPDLPNSFDAASGFGIAIRSLTAKMPEVGLLATGLEALRRSQVLMASSKLRQRRPLARRREKYEIWDVCLKLSEKSAAQLTLPAAILGAMILLSYVRGAPVCTRMLKKVKHACLVGKDTKAGRWTGSAQAKALRSVLEDLRSACVENPADARRLGVIQAPPVADERERPDPAQVLNQLLRKRWSSSADYTPPRVCQGVLGHGTLTANLARDCGLGIRHGAEAGDPVQVVLVFEAIFNLTPALVHAIPLSDDESSGGAWIRLSLARNAVRIDLEWVIAAGAKPASGTEHLYEKASRAYWVQLPPWMRQIWSARSKDPASTGATTLGELLGNAWHHSKADITGGNAAYALTANRFRQTFPNLALSSGTPRMVATLMLCQFGLVSPGRPYYGLVHGTDLTTGCSHLYRKLGWLGRRERLPELEFKTGSLVVPTDAAVQQAFSSLVRTSAHAEQAFEDDPCEDTWVRRHQALIAYLALAAELDLCLRESERYQLSPLEIRSRTQRVHVDDKHVHDLGGGPALGKSSRFQALIVGWVDYLQSVNSEPCLQRSALGGILRAACSRALHAREDGNLLVDFDVAGNQVSVGTATWRSMLPPHLKLVDNFGRQYWPSRIHEAGLRQRHLDYLLRHRLHSWEHQTGVDPEPSESVRGELLAAVDATMARLALPIPRTFLRTAAQA